MIRTPERLFRIISSPWVSFISSVFVMATAGSLFTFSSFSEPFRISLGYSAKDINMIASFGNTALYITFLFIGPFYDRFGPMQTMLIATLLNGLGYGLMYLTYTQRISGNVISMSIYYFLVGSAASCLYLVSVAVNLNNFSNQTVRGVTLGILLLFYGLSATIYAQIFRFLYSNAISGTVDVSGFLLFLTISMVLINGASMFLIKKQSSSQFNTIVLVDSSAPPVANTNDNISPFSILKTPSFWFFTLAVIWQQSLTYFSNVSIIIKAISGNLSTDSIYVSNISSIHVTILSVFQSIGRFCGGFVSQYDSKAWFSNKRLILLWTDMFLFIPCVILGFSSMDPIKLYVCSAMIGLGWGTAGGIFPGLIRSIFGMKHFGTANGFVLGGVPISIFVCNYVFGVLYDIETARQNALTTDVKCLGTSCFDTSYKIFAGMQVFTLAMALSLVLQGFREQRSVSIHSSSFVVENLKDSESSDGNDTQMHLFATELKPLDRVASKSSLARLDSTRSNVSNRLSRTSTRRLTIGSSPHLHRIPSLAQVSMLNTSYAGSDIESIRSSNDIRRSITQRKHSGNASRQKEADRTQPVDVNVVEGSEDKKEILESNKIVN